MYKLYFVLVEQIFLSLVFEIKTTFHSFKAISMYIIIIVVPDKMLPNPFTFSISTIHLFLYFFSQLSSFKTLLGNGYMLSH